MAWKQWIMVRLTKETHARLTKYIQDLERNSKKRRGLFAYKPGKLDRRWSNDDAVSHLLDHVDKNRQSAARSAAKKAAKSDTHIQPGESNGHSSETGTTRTTNPRDVHQRTN